MCSDRCSPGFSLSYGSHLNDSNFANYNDLQCKPCHNMKCEKHCNLKGLTQDVQNLTRIEYQPWFGCTKIVGPLVISITNEGNLR